jgi:hypothetical protein
MVINPTRTVDCFARFANNRKLTSPLAVEENNCHFVAERDIDRFNESTRGNSRSVWLGGELCSNSCSNDLAQGSEETASVATDSVAVAVDGVVLDNVRCCW